MLKRKIYLLLIVVFGFALAACSGTTASGTTLQSTGSQSSSNQAQQNSGANPANQSIESKLAIGTLKLEGTSQAITAEQAKTLLPLWKAVKSLSSSSTVSTDEMTALYKQIQEAMTADQIKTITNLSLTQTDFQTLAQQYGVQMPQPGANPQGTPVARSGRSSSGSTTGSNNNAGGFPGGPGGGFPPDGGPGGVPGVQGQSGTNGTSATPRAQGTRPAGAGPRGAGGMNTIFLDPLIKLLGQRAAA